MGFEVRGQVSIWVILGIILAASIVLFFLLSPSAELLKPADSDVSFDMQTFLETCTAQYVGEAVDLMLPQGGFVNPRNTVFFDGNNIEYICFNNGNYSPCIHQHPLLLNEMKLEIDNYVTPLIDDCFEDMKREFEGRRGDVEYDLNFDVEVNLKKDVVALEIKRETTIVKQGDTRNLGGFKIEVSSPVYNLGKVAMEIANQEANFCYFEFVGYNLHYPRYQIKKYTLSDPIDIYTITDIKTRKEMNIAVRGCTLPAGL